MISPGRVIRENRNGRAAWVLDRDFRTLPDFGRSRVVRRSFTRARMPISTLSPFVSALDDHILFKQTAGIDHRTIGHLGCVGLIPMLRVDKGMRQ
jgi:hypothetical protein